MGFPVTSYCERNVFTDPPIVITLSAGQTKLALPNEQANPQGGSITQRLIQNTGSDDLYYSENLVDSSTNPVTPICDATVNYHGKLSAGQQLDCSGHAQAVSVYSAAGTTIAVTIRRKPQY